MKRDIDITARNGMRGLSLGVTGCVTQLKNDDCKFILAKYIKYEQ
jgi:hypothetical protein